LLLVVIISSVSYAGLIKCPNCGSSIGYIRDNESIHYSKEAKKILKARDAKDSSRFEEAAKRAAMETDYSFWGKELEVRLKEMLNEIEVLLWDWERIK